MTVQLRSTAVTNAINANRIDEASAKAIDAAVVMFAKYATINDQPSCDVLQRKALDAVDKGMKSHEQVVFNMAYGELRAKGDKALYAFVAASESPPAPVSTPAPAAKPSAPAVVVTAADACQGKKSFLARLFT